LGNYFSPSADCADAVDSAATPLTLNIMSTDGTHQPRGLYPVVQQYKRAGLSQRPIVIGGTLLDAVAWQENAIRAAQTNLALQNNGNFSGLPNMFVDYDIDATFGDGDSHAFSLVPGAVHRLFWNQFEGENAYASQTLVKRKFDLGALFGDPGFVVDQSIYVDECGDCDVRFIYKFHLSTDLFSIPSDAFNTTTCGQCSNYLLGWLLACGAIDCTNFTAPVLPPE
jgi:hypothetical protein